MTHKNTKWVSLLLAGLLLPLISFALPSDKNKPLTVTSDQLTIQYKAGVATYSGHVVAIQGSRKLTGDKAIIYRNNATQQLAKIEVLGQPAHYQFTPQPNQKPFYASGNEITYTPDTHLLVLKHDAQVSQSGNVFKGPKITYNTKTGVINAPSSGSTRPSVTLEPYDQLKKESEFSTS